MSIVPLHLQRRFELRWAAQFGSKVVPSVPANVGSKGSPDKRCPPRGKGQRKTRRVELAGSKSAFSGVSFFHRTGTVSRVSKERLTRRRQTPRNLLMRLIISMVYSPYRCCLRSPIAR